MIRSLWLFGCEKDLLSLQAFALHVKPYGGLCYGHINLDEVYFMKPELTDHAKDLAPVCQEVEFPSLPDGSSVRVACGEVLLHFLYTDLLPLDTATHLAAELVGIGEMLGLPRLSALAT
jgi:hypothetical protein